MCAASFLLQILARLFTKPLVSFLNVRAPFGTIPDASANN
jgi:hypothetical protein